MLGLQRPSVALLATSAALAAGCGSGGDRLDVFAAASLAAVMGDLEPVFEAEHPDFDVVVNLAGSSTLAAQILAGAEAAVFASADEVQMDIVREGLGLPSATTFATNRLVIVVAPGNPLGVSGLGDLAQRDDVVVSLAAPEVPAGRYALAAFDQAGLTVGPATLEADVRGVVTRVALGEADAGLAYVTDVLGRSDVEGVPLPAEVDVVVEYPVLAVDSRLGAEFVDLLGSERGRSILAANGFGLP